MKKVLFIPCLLIILSCSDTDSMRIKLGENFYLDYAPSGHAIITDSIRRYFIDSEIIAWNFDSIFIIAKQKPFLSIADSIKRQYHDIRHDRLDALYQKTEKYVYWIIDKREGLENDSTDRKLSCSLKGPFSYADYWMHRKDLDVPEALKLLKTEKKHFDSPVHALIYYLFNSPRKTVVE